MGTTHDLVTQINSTSKSSFVNDDERKRAVDAARSLVNRLEQPIETIFRLVWLHPTLMTVLRTVSQLKLFENWEAIRSDSLDEEQLAELVQCDRQLLSRLLKQLASNQILEYANESHYRMTDFAHALSGPEITSCLNMFFDFQMPIFLDLPDFLASTGYRNPTNPMENVWSHSKGEDFMSFMKSRPPVYENLMMAMKASVPFRGSLAHDYPEKRMEELIASSDPSEPLLVDVAGSIGHDLSAFHQKYPQTRGRLVLQDLPNVLEMITDLDSAISKVPLDFFVEAPVKAAAIYYLHSILHDWPDTECVTILRNVRRAMVPGRSRLLVHDVVIDSHNPSAEATSCDITMMGMSSGKERTDSDFRGLFDQAGFRIVSIWFNPTAIAGIIEAEICQ